MPKKRVKLSRKVDEITQAVCEKLKDLNTDPTDDPKELRNRILKLVEVQRDLRELSLHHSQKLLSPKSASERILEYLRMFVATEIEGEEVDVVSGISEYGRRVREWEDEFGWPIRTRGTSYILEKDEPDEGKAALWQKLNEIRRSEKSARDRMLDLFLAFPGQVITTSQLRYVTDNKDMRRVRELRTQLGYRIMTKYTGRPELKPGEYILVDPEPVEEHDRKIPDKVLAAVLTRDGHRCRKAGCGWHPKDRVPGDPRQYIEVHHKTWHVERGKNEAENLVTLCNVHHREVHRSKIGPDKLGEWMRTEE